MSDPKVIVSIFDTEESTSVKHQTFDPIWNEFLMLIVPFKHINAVIEKNAAALQQYHAFSCFVLFCFCVFFQFSIVLRLYLCDILYVFCVSNFFVLV